MARAAAALEHAAAAGATFVDLPVAETPPKRVENELEEARLAVSKMLSAPAALEFQERRWTLGEKEIANLVTVEQQIGIPASVSLREESLQQTIGRIAAQIDQPAMNARLDWNGGSPKALSPGQEPIPPPSRNVLMVGSKKQ